jgi:hypothetical protein
VQVDVGHKFNVHSIRAPDCPSVPLKLVRGDIFRWHFIQRNGEATLKPALEWLTFTLRLPDNYQAGALLNIEDTAPAAEHIRAALRLSVCGSLYWRAHRADLRPPRQTDRTGRGEDRR